MSLFGALDLGCLNFEVAVESGSGSVPDLACHVGFGKRCFFFTALYGTKKTHLAKNHLVQKGAMSQWGFASYTAILYMKKTLQSVDYSDRGGWLPPGIKASGCFLDFKHLLLLNPLAQTICLLFSAGHFEFQEKMKCGHFLQTRLFFQGQNQRGVTCKHSHDILDPMGWMKFTKNHHFT